MIDLRSSATAENVSHLSCDSPSPGGSNERSECRFVCCSGVGRDEGELNLCERSERHFLCCSNVQRGHPAMRYADTSAHSTLSLLPLFPSASLAEAFPRSAVSPWRIGAKADVPKSALIRTKGPKMPKPSQSYPRLAKPAQATSSGRGSPLFGFAPRLNLFAAICTY